MNEVKEKDKSIDLKIEVKNFGPIFGGKITLKPLTLFIGPNNSGKSYAAMLIHSIYESYTPIDLINSVPHFMRTRFFTEGIDINAFLDESPELRKHLNELIENLKKVGKLEVPRQIIQSITNRIFEEIYENRLNDEIVRSFASPLKELIMIGKRTFELKIHMDSHEIYTIYRKNKLKVEKYPQLNVKVKIKIEEIESPRPTIRVKSREDEILIEMGGKWKDNKILYFPLIDVILETIASRILKNIGKHCYYLPAARSGILQGHKALVASIVKKAPYVGIEKLEIPKFSGVVSDFISSLLILPEKKGPFYEVAKDFENELIKGEIIIRKLEDYLYPEIRYKFRGTEIPLHRASSTVSELAPLFLYLKYILQPGSILIIEEPEAHLHPENQRILAKFLVKLIRKGISIVITTHSEYLLEQLSSFILLSKVKARRRIEKYKYSEEDYLNPNEVSAYVFSYDERSKGHKIIEVEVTEEDGISQEEFIKIHEALYEETIMLRRELYHNQ